MDIAGVVTKAPKPENPMTESTNILSVDGYSSVKVVRFVRWLNSSLVSISSSNCMICIREIKLVVESITQLVDDRVCSSSWNGRLKLWRLTCLYPQGTEPRQDAHRSSCNAHRVNVHGVMSNFFFPRE
jgi:hypothetical protein